MSINRVNVTGNLTRDPELRTSTGGSPVLRLGVAVNDRRKNPQTGQWEDVPNFVDCVMFGQRAASVAQYLSKGTKVAVDGRLRYSSWQAQDGSKHSRLEVAVDEIEFMSPRQQAPQYQQAPQGYRQPARPAAPKQYAPAPPRIPAQPAPQQAQYAPAPQPPAPDVYEDDIPF